MAIYVVQAQINSVNLQPEDEIAIFDGDICVGDKAIKDKMPSFETPLLIQTSQEDGDGCGFREGESIIVKVWDAGDSLELVDALQFYDIQTGDSIQAVPFQPNGSCAVGFNIKYPPEFPHIDIAPTSYYYGKVRIGANADGNVVITNSGDDVLHIETPTLSGANADQFFLSAGCRAVSLNPAYSHTMTVEFVPTTNGLKTADLNIFSNDPQLPHAIIPLSGQGIEPEIEASPQSINFGSVKLDSILFSSVLILNAGDAPLELTSMGIVGDIKNQFKINSGGNPTTLEPGYTTTVTLEFQPQVPGQHFAEFQIYSDDADESLTKIALAGTGLENHFYLAIHTSPEGAGTTVPSEGVYDYAVNEIVSIHAIPASEHQFVHWQGAVNDPLNPSTTVRMESDKTVTAVFKKISDAKYTLTLLADPLDAGFTVPAAGTSVHDAGSVVNLFAAPKNGFAFDKWMGDVTDPHSQNTTVTMSSDKTITAKFFATSHRVTIRTEPVGAGWTIPTIGDTMVANADSITVKAFAEHNFKFLRWGGSIDSRANPLRIRVDHDLFLTALFESETPVLTQPNLLAPEHGFCQQELDFYVKQDTSLSLEYQFEWGDSSRSAWTNVLHQRNHNITTITAPASPFDCLHHGRLADFQTGRQLDAQLSVYGETAEPAVDAWLGAQPLSGTDAYELFGNVVNCRGAICGQSGSNSSVVLLFSQLSPDKEYLLALYSNADIYGWDAATRVTLQDAASFVNKSSVGKNYTGEPLFADQHSPITQLPSDNSMTGYVALFDKIKPGPDGAVKLFVSFESSVSSVKSVLANAVMLQEIQPGTATPTFTAYNDLGWSHSFSSHRYKTAGSYQVKVRSRRSNQPDLLSPWSEVAHLTIEGCRVLAIVTGGAAATINKMPEKEWYDYGEMVTLMAITQTGWAFKHWDADPGDSVATRRIYVNHHQSFYAYFERLTDLAQKSTTVQTTCHLEQNYPNPFNPSTDICYTLARPEFTVLKIYNVRGELVRTLVSAQKLAGEYHEQWDATDESGSKVPSGVYFYKLTAGRFRQTRRMLLLE